MSEDFAQGAPFPTTHWSVLKRATPVDHQEDARREGTEALARLYWRPVYAHFRFRWSQSPAESEDLTQQFFVWVLQGPFLERAEPGHGRFRNFVRAHLDNFMRNHLRAGKRLRRGGDRKILSLDFGESPESFLPNSNDISPEEILDHQWRMAILEESLSRLRNALKEEGRPEVFEVLCRYDLVESEKDRPSYTQLAKDLGLASHDVDNFLSQARKRLYRHVRDIVSESVDGPEALKQELDAFFPGLGDTPE